MGGNTLASLAGLDPRESVRAFVGRVLEQRSDFAFMDLAMVLPSCERVGEEHLSMTLADVFELALQPEGAALHEPLVQPAPGRLWPKVFSYLAQCFRCLCSCRSNIRLQLG